MSIRRRRRNRGRRKARARDERYVWACLNKAASMTLYAVADLAIECALMELRDEMTKSMRLAWEDDKLRPFKDLGQVVP